MVRAITALLLLVSCSYGNVYYRTNDILALNPNANTMQAQLNAQFRITARAVESGAPVDLTGYTAYYLMIDERDGLPVNSNTVTFVDRVNGEFSVRMTITSPPFDLGVQYRGVAEAYYDGTYFGRIADNYITIVNPACTTCGVTSAGGGGSTSVTVTNLIVSTNIISVTVTNTGGGGGGSGTLSGFNSATTGGVFLVVSNGWDASITNEGNVFTIKTGLPRGATGVNQVATWNGTNWIATALGAPTPTPTVGTNVQKFATVWGVTNTFVAPSTQIMFTAWGATGGGGSSGGGHTRALWVGSAGTIFDIVVGTRGNPTSTNNGPFSGAGISGGATNVYNGGGATYISISGTTNIILIAGGSGGGGGNVAGGPGGGFWFGSTDGSTTATNASPGQGAWASNEYGQAATAGTNIAVTSTNTMHNGGYLQGGHASTNGCTAGATGNLGGGGGGWYGGAGATRTNATIGTSLSGAGASGGGGLGYANTNFVTFAQVFSGARGILQPPAGQDHPTYTSGRAVGSNSGAIGNDGCAGAMW